MFAYIKGTGMIQSFWLLSSMMKTVSSRYNVIHNIHRELTKIELEDLCDSNIAVCIVKGMSQNKSLC